MGRAYIIPIRRRQQISPRKLERTNTMQQEQLYSTLTERTNTINYLKEEIKARQAINRQFSKYENIVDTNCALIREYQDTIDMLIEWDIR